MSKGSKPSMDMTAQRMVNWVSRIMKVFSLELKVEKGSGDIYISPLGDIVELIRKKNARGRYYQDEGDLLKLKRCPAACMFDTSVLDVDVFIDEEVPEVPSQVPEPVRVPCGVASADHRAKRVRSSRFVPDIDW